MSNQAFSKLKNALSRLLQFISALFEVNDLLAIKRLKKAFSKVEFYQPLYGCSFINGNKRNKEPQRPCLDRAEAVMQHLRQYGKGLKLVDFGSSLGYFCYYFAHHGYKTTGIDMRKQNIAVANALKYFNKKTEKVTFLEGTLDNTWIDSIEYRQYDVAFIFSVLHHINMYQGLEPLQQLLKKLLDKIPLLYIELATKNEPVSSGPWHASLPQDILDYFKLCDDVNVELLDYFPIHLSEIYRPLYCVTKKTITLNNQSYPIEKMKFTAYENARYFGRTYIQSTPFFIKEYLHGKKRNLVAIAKEKSAYEQVNRFTDAALPRLRDFVVESHSTYFVLDYIPGESLFTLLSRQVVTPSMSMVIMQQLIAALSQLKKQGQLYHNDIRLWNIFYHAGKTSVIDLSHADKIETEQSCIALLWVLQQLANNYPYYQMRHGAYPIVDKPSFELENMQPALREWAELLSQAASFDDFLATPRVQTLLATKT